MEISVSILDNDPMFLGLLKEVLDKHFKVNATSDTNELMSKIVMPAIVVIDWYLDYGITGLDVMRKIRDKHPLCHFIFISTIASVDVLLSVINEGWGCYFLIKNKSNFFDELITNITNAKQLLNSKMTAASAQVNKNELLQDRIIKTLKVLEESSNGRSY